MILTACTPRPLRTYLLSGMAERDGQPLPEEMVLCPGLRQEDEENVPGDDAGW
jgi:hypothetical protein